MLSDNKLLYTYTGMSKPPFYSYLIWRKTQGKMNTKLNVQIKRDCQLGTTSLQKQTSFASQLLCRLVLFKILITILATAISKLLWFKCLVTNTGGVILNWIMSWRG